MATDRTHTVDCRTEEGVTVGLVDSLITTCRVLARRDLRLSPAVRAALADLNADEDVATVLLEAEVAAEEPDEVPHAG